MSEETHPAPVARGRAGDRPRPGVAVLPPPAGRADGLVAAVTAGGARVTAPEEAGALVWTDHRDPQGLGRLLDAQPGLRWVQLPWAGIEPYVEVVAAHADRIWTCGKGVYAEPVAEHALALALAGLRGIDRFARARTWTSPRGHNLLGAEVAVVGGGGIARSLLHLLEPFRCQVTVVRRSGAPVPGAARVVGPEGLDSALAGARLAVLALPLVAATEGLVDARRLALVGPDGCLVNVARGRHVVTDDLVAALR
ncbi:MAG TPA: NAD(P)-dependent oxidoreductase, partial [Acidimicrobiales bacterium]|nr:NAD(P)-dependent oxidoreductase [Acidimicrobiales bacterium]